MSRILKDAINQITQPFGNGHIGVDLVKQFGQTSYITAHTHGKVVEVRNNCSGFEPGGSYGNYVLIEHQSNVRTRYAHLSSVYVSVGQTVSTADVIGYMGNTGTSYGAHLHFEVILDGKIVNPTPYIDSSLPRQSTKSGLVKHGDNDWYYYRDGVIDKSYNGIVKNENGWWKVTSGKVDFSYNGLAKNENGWWMLQDGKVDFSYDGLAINENGVWILEKGKVNFGYTGTTQFSGKTYNIKGGKVV